MNLQFDPKRHIYKLDGKIIPNVTQIINELIPIQYKPGDWYLQRGSAVHACAALIAKDVDFEFDQRISGQVGAIRKFFREVQPEVLAIEKMLYSEQYRFAGTLDLFIKIDRKYCLIDYKSSISIDRLGLQLAGYSLAFNEELLKAKVTYGIGIEINETGKYKMTELLDIRKWQREFLALRATYAVRERLGLNKKQEDQS